MVNDIMTTISQPLAVPEIPLRRKLLHLAMWLVCAVLLAWVWRGA